MLENPVSLFYCPWRAGELGLKMFCVNEPEYWSVGVMGKTSGIQFERITRAGTASQKASDARRASPEE